MVMNVKNVNMVWWKTRVYVGDGITVTDTTFDSLKEANKSFTELKKSPGDRPALIVFDPENVPADKEEAGFWREEMLSHLTEDGLLGAMEELLDLAAEHQHDEDCVNSEQGCFVTTFFEVYDTQAKLRHKMTPWP